MAMSGGAAGPAHVLELLKGQGAQRRVTPERAARRAVSRLNKLGFRVTPDPMDAASE
jgi:hypothetical protein